MSIQIGACTISTRTRLGGNRGNVAIWYLVPGMYHARTYECTMYHVYSHHVPGLYSWIVYWVSRPEMYFPSGRSAHRRGVGSLLDRVPQPLRVGRGDAPHAETKQSVVQLKADRFCSLAEVSVRGFGVKCCLRHLRGPFFAGRRDTGTLGLSRFGGAGCVSCTGYTSYPHLTSLAAAAM